MSKFTSFLRFYVLKNPAIWLAKSILSYNSKIRILQDGIGGEMLMNSINFHFRLIPRKTNDKIFQKIVKTLFLPKFRWKWIFLEKRNLPGFKYSNHLQSCKKSEKINDSLLRKMLNWQKDKQMDREKIRQQWFCEILHRLGVKKERSKNSNENVKWFPTIWGT